MTATKVTKPLTERKEPKPTKETTRKKQGVRIHKATFKDETTMADAHEYRNRLLDAIDRHQRSPLSWEHHVLACWQLHTDEATLDERHDTREFRVINGRFRSRLWTFIRHLKTHEATRGISSAQAWSMTNRIVEQWEIDDPWGEYFGVDGDVEIQFIDLYDTIRTIPGVSPIELALSNAHDQPIQWDTTVASKPYRRYLTFLAWLQVAVGDLPLLLAVEHLAEVFETTPITISRYNKRARQEGYIRPTCPEIPNRKARQYRFNVALCDAIASAAHPDCDALFEEAHEEYRRNKARKTAKK